MTEQPRRGRERNRRQRPTKGEDDPTFAGIVVGFAQAVRKMIFGPPPTDEPPDDGGMAGSRVPRRPPDRSGSGSVALVEPIAADADLEDQVDPHTRPAR